MFTLLLITLSQGPGSTLEVKKPDSALPLPVSHPTTSLKTRPAEGRPGSVVELNALSMAKKVTLTEGQWHFCEGQALQFLCDDAEIVKGEIRDEPLRLSEDLAPITPHARFEALKAGFTVCSCGLPKNLQWIYAITVISLEEAVKPVVSRAVAAAYARLLD